MLIDTSLNHKWLERKSVKKQSLTFLVLAITLMLIFFSFDFKGVKAEDSENYVIKRVDHTVAILSNGYVFINDTINILGNSWQGATMESFVIGFPYQYGSYIIKCVAYNASKTFDVRLNAPLEGRVGFYAVEVIFPEPLNISVGNEYVFAVSFIFSNRLLNMLETSKFTLNFPAYPSLAMPTINCSVKIDLPEDATDINIIKDDGNVENASAYFRENLPAFAHYPANLAFSLPKDKLQIFDIEELKREIAVNGLGEIFGQDSYYIINKMSRDIETIEIVLPSNASILGAYDQFGRKFESDPSLIDAETNRYRVTLALPVEDYKSTRFSVRYSLPHQGYLNTQGGDNKLDGSLFLFHNIDYYVKQSTVSFVFPEGGRLIAPETIAFADSYSVTRSVFQETLTINMQSVSFLNDIPPLKNNFQISYSYNPLWLSFRPTLWIWALSLLGCAIVLVWKRPKVAAPVTVPTIALRLHPEIIESFVDSYEDKKKIILELESLEKSVKKGRIPRRRYKVRKKTLETRLNTLSKKLLEYKEKMRAAGGKYADLMRQMEVAETEITEVEANIKSIQMRHRRGDLSLEAYRKLLTDYRHRKEQAEVTINGVLLRLREDIR